MWWSALADLEKRAKRIFSLKKKFYDKVEISNSRKNIHSFLLAKVGFYIIICFCFLFFMEKIVALIFYGQLKQTTTL